MAASIAFLGRTPRAPSLARLGLILLPVLASLGCNREPAPPAIVLSPQEKDRAELVLQSRRGWVSENAPRKLTLMLISEKSSVRKGEVSRYRLEIKNVGREPITFKESAPSFIKGGSLCGDHGYRFYVTPPGRTERRLPCEPANAAVTAAMPPDTGLDQTLRSGDYLLTRPDGLTTRFRTLKTAFRFNRLGIYRLRVVYTDGKLRADSNPVAMTVVR